MLSLPTQVSPHTVSSSCFLLSTMPGRDDSAARTSNSVRVNVTGLSPTCTSRPSTLMRNAPKTRGGLSSGVTAAGDSGARRGRRSMARTRATTSRGLKGLVT
ncbi:Uncharacterised protein [Mycobacteroides abscessus subsp. abscessus]|nr:Uncharacterised protein [Mycobacteroides abscessus subsp. abscessus]